MEQESWERNHRRASWNRHHGTGIMGEESWEETSWERNHGKENHGRKLPRGSKEAPQRLPGGPQKLPRGSQEAPRRHLGQPRLQEAPERG